MLQRLQSVFLLLASGAVFSLESPYVSFMSLIHGVPVNHSPYDNKFFNIYDDSILYFGTAITGLLLIVSVFLFKNRKNQALLAMLSNFVIGALLLYGLWEARETFARTVQPENVQASDIALQSNYGYAVPVLIVAMVLSWLAVRYIRKDERLVRSADRLR